MKAGAHVLFIGVSGPVNLPYAQPLEERGYVLAAAPGYRDLCQIEMCSRFEIAVILPTLTLAEFLEVAHFIRRQWPLARILILRPEEWWIDDALYDERVTPGTDPDPLLSALERLAG
jgi:hypothetical protein